MWLLARTPWELTSWTATLWRCTKSTSSGSFGASGPKWPSWQRRPWLFPSSGVSSPWVRCWDRSLAAFTAQTLSSGLRSVESGASRRLESSQLATNLSDYTAQRILSGRSHWKQPRSRTGTRSQAVASLRSTSCFQPGWLCWCFWAASCRPWWCAAVTHVRKDTASLLQTLINLSEETWITTRSRATTLWVTTRAMANSSRTTAKTWVLNSELSETRDCGGTTYELRCASSILTGNVS